MSPYENKQRIHIPYIHTHLQIMYTHYRPIHNYEINVYVYNEVTYIKIFIILRF